MTTTAVPPPLRSGPLAQFTPGPHERIEVRHDARTGLRLIVAVHSTALGPALGGLRLRQYAGGLPEALDDVMALSSTMTLKAAAAGLDLGGGKAVILDDGRMPPGSSARAARLEAAGRVIEEMGGAYVTAEDVGTSTDDMEAIARGTRYVVGRAPSAGGLGDPSPATAQTVFRAIRVALAHAGDRGASDPTASGAVAGRRVGVIGLGKVGSVLADLLLEAGARVLAFDVVPDRLVRARARGVEVAASAAAVLQAPLDVVAPCALGGLVDEQVAGGLDCKVVCGAANNPLAGAGTAGLLADRGVLYVPDFLANCGGLVHVAAEWEGRDGGGLASALDRAERQLERALAQAATTGVTPLEAARQIAGERIGQTRRGHCA